MKGLGFPLPQGATCVSGRTPEGVRSQSKPLMGDVKEYADVLSSTFGAPEKKPRSERVGDACVPHALKLP